MAAVSRELKLFLLGIFVHILYLAAIFDVYFRSPLVQNLRPLPVATKGPAKRLVLFIADGLRADRFYETGKDFPKSRAPFLRHVIEEKGSWGISHSRVPTETRPGHVALIAGFFEDVSAVTKGWQENPVDFDSVFNESRLTYCWGSSDVVPMFATKAAKHRVITYSYAEDMVDFADKNGARLDEWVFHEVEKFFEKAKLNHTLLEQLNGDKLVFFLHLLGLDVNGHGYRPNSQEYLGNINSVDLGIKRMVQIFESFYENDAKTSYIMTSDHGMSDWGSHGSGHPDETLTPIVAWGAGLRGPRRSDKNDGEHKDSFSEQWQLQDLARTDISQIDVAALMSALIGVPFPVNSLGIVPVDFLDTADNYKAESLFRNAKQILSQYKQKQLSVKRSAFFFRPFRLTGSVQEEFIRNISSLIRENKFGEAMRLSRGLIKLALNGLQYYHSHNTIYIAICVTIGFIGWILLVVLEIIKNYSNLDLKFNKLQMNMSNRRMPSQKFLKISFGITAVVIMFGLLATSALLSEYFYCLMPLLVFYELSLDQSTILNLLRMPQDQFSWVKSFLYVAVYGLLLSLLVTSFTYRGMLSIILLGLGVFPVVFRKRITFFTVSWLIACLLLSIFPMLPTIGRIENYGYVALTGLLIASTSLVFACTFVIETKNSIVVTVLVAAVAFCTLLRLHTAQSINAKLGLPIANQIASWVLIPLLPLVALITAKESISRLVAVVTSLLSIYILTCVSHEGFFAYLLTLTMLLWIKVEQQLMTRPKSSINLTSRSHNPTRLSLDHVRISFMFIFFMLLAFFGTGNIASLNSFDLAAVNCFTTVFRPMVMASLFFVKILIPLLVVSCAFSAMQKSLSVQIRGLFYIVMVMTDIMSIIFFFLIKDEGSWQEIGTSITHYVIMLAFVIFLVPLFELAYLLTGSVSFKMDKAHSN